jgi:Hydroxymethylglutaryl-CoA reductase
MNYYEYYTYSGVIFLLFSYSIPICSILCYSEAMEWLQDSDNFASLKTSFDSSSRFAKLRRISVRIAGHDLYVRFVATTGDAMGMNMLSKGKTCASHSLSGFQNR